MYTGNRQTKHTVAPWQNTHHHLVSAFNPGHFALDLGKSLLNKPNGATGSWGLSLGNTQGRKQGSRVAGGLVLDGFTGDRNGHIPGKRENKQARQFL